MKNKKIVLAIVEKIEKAHIVVKYKDNLYTIKSHQISDYTVNLFEYFIVGKVYKFCLIDNRYLSYKAVRPKLLKNKKAPMPTISGSKTLEKNLLNFIRFQKMKAHQKREKKSKTQSQTKL